MTTLQETDKKERVYLLDLARFLAMVFMMQGHTLDSLVSPKFLDVTTFPWNIWHSFRGLTAPVFLIISGAVHVYVLKRDENGRLTNDTIYKRIRWAAIIMMIGYLLVFPANRMYDLIYLDVKGWQVFFQVNILQLTGISLVLLLLVAMLTRSSQSLGRASLGIGIAITFITPFVQYIDWFLYIPEGIAAYISFEHGSIFPVFPFASYLFYGVALGSYLKNVPSDQWTQKLKKLALTIGLPLFVIGVGLNIFQAHLNGTELAEFGRASAGLVLTRIGIVLGILSFLSYIYPYVKSFDQYTIIFSRKSLYIYVIHLVLLYGCTWFPSIAKLYPQQLPLWAGLTLVPIVISITLGFVAVIHFAEKRSNKLINALRFTLIGFLIYMLFLQF